MFLDKLTKKISSANTSAGDSLLVFMKFNISLYNHILIYYTIISIRATTQQNLKFAIQ